MPFSDAIKIQVLEWMSKGAGSIVNAMPYEKFCVNSNWMIDYIKFHNKPPEDLYMHPLSILSQQRATEDLISTSTALSVAPVSLSAEGRSLRSKEKFACVRTNNTLRGIKENSVIVDIFADLEAIYTAIGGEEWRRISYRVCILFL